MVRFEDWLQQERQVAQQRLLGADTPVVGDVDVRTALLERPDADALEVAVGDDREAVRIS